MSYLLESPDKSERVHSESRDGYDGWTLLAEGPDSEPVEHATFDGKRWVVDEEAKAAAKRASKLRGMPREEFMALIDAKLTEQAERHDAEIAKLKGPAK